MNADELIKATAKQVCEDHGIKKNGAPTWVEALAWEMGEGITHEYAIRHLILTAAQIEKENAS